MAESDQMSTVIDVLVVESDPSDQRMLQRALRREGRGMFRLVKAGSLAEGLERLRARGFGVVLVDMELPDGHGLDCYLSLSAAAPDTPVVVLAEEDDEDTAIQAVQRGAQDYILKGRMEGPVIEGPLVVNTLRSAVERQRLMAELQAQSMLDELTGLYNRRGFFKLAQQHVKMADRVKVGLILVYADLDGLKSINDTFGHPVGDRALKEVARILRQTFRESDVVARLGGDEFVVLALQDPSSDSTHIRRRVDENLQAYNEKEVLPFPLKLSVGICQYDYRVPQSIEEMLAMADRQMYDGKGRTATDALPTDQ